MGSRLTASTRTFLALPTLGALALVMAFDLSGCASAPDAEAAGSSSQAIEEGDTLQADVDARIAELEAIASQIELENLLAQESGQCLASELVSVTSPVADTVTSPAPVAPPIPAITIETAAPDAGSSTQIDTKAPGTKIANTALIIALTERLERLNGLFGRIERAEKLCAKCGAAAEKLAKIVTSSAETIVKAEAAIAEAAAKLKTNAFWAQLSNEERFALERWLRLGVYESKPGVWVRGAPKAGEWPSWFSKWQYVVERPTSGYAAGVERWTRATNLAEEARVINFIAKSHLAKCPK